MFGYRVSGRGTGWEGSSTASEAEFADVGGVGGEGHGFEVHGAHAVVGADDGAEEAAAEVELHGVGLDGEVLGLAGEVAEDDEDGIGG